MRALMNLINSVNGGIGKSCAWLSLGIVLVQFTVVVMRYVFGLGSIWMQESITYMHGFLFMLAAAYTLSVDGTCGSTYSTVMHVPASKQWLICSVRSPSFFRCVP